ncbi:MAG: gas vesicle protein GvpG [Candidatus Contendobacter sp.]|nr:gas vesicle protein GvpG [Candidatus Contendobacter sp.]
MLLLDDILFAPAKGLMWVFREIHHAAEQEMEQEAEQITAELSALYQALETGTLSEAEFDAREKVLLDRLDALQGAEDQEDEADPDEGEVESADNAETLTGEDDHA